MFFLLYDIKNTYPKSINLTSHFQKFDLPNLQLFTGVNFGCNGFEFNLENVKENKLNFEGMEIDSHLLDGQHTTTLLRVEISSLLI